MPFPVVWFEVAGPDGKALQSFYSSVFGWKIDANNPMDYGMVEATGQGIGGGVSGAPPGHAHVTFYIQADDPNAALATIEKHGGKIVMPLDQVPGGPMIAQFADPAGNVVGLMKMPG
jgi:uncharacterized protein